VKAKTVITMSFQQHQHELFESTLSGNVNFVSSAECSFYVRIIGKCACFDYVNPKDFYDYNDSN